MTQKGIVARPLFSLHKNKNFRHYLSFLRLFSNKRNKGFFGKMAASGAGVGKLQDEPGVSSSVRKRGSAERKKRGGGDWACHGTYETAEEAPGGRRWYNLNNKINIALLDYSPKHQINT